MGTVNFPEKDYTLTLTYTIEKKTYATDYSGNPVYETETEWYDEWDEEEGKYVEKSRTVTKKDSDGNPIRKIDTDTNNYSATVTMKKSGSTTFLKITPDTTGLAAEEVVIHNPDIGVSKAFAIAPDLYFDGYCPQGFFNQDDYTNGRVAGGREQTISLGSKSIGVNDDTTVAEALEDKIGDMTFEEYAMDKLESMSVVGDFWSVSTDTLSAYYSLGGVSVDCNGPLVDYMKVFRTGLSYYFI